MRVFKWLLGIYIINDYAKQAQSALIVLLDYTCLLLLFVRLCFVADIDVVFRGTTW